MAGISASGLGSGIDVNGLVSQLVSAERTPAATRLATKEAGYQAKLSALGTFKSALAALRTAIGALRSGGVFGQRSVSVGDSTLLRASATSAAGTGTYGVEVVSLAQPQKLKSAAVASADTVLGTGTLTVSLGTASFAVTIDSSHQTLAGIRDAINQATDNVGVSATIVNGEDGAHLVLTGQKPGADNTIRVARGLLDLGLQPLVYDPPAATTMAVQQAATDAEIAVEGVSHFSDSNTVTGAIDGATLTLLKADPGNATTVTIANDTAGLTGAVAGFVKAYNDAIKAIGDLTKYNAAAKQGSVLTGDALLRGAQAQLRTLVSGFTASGEFKSLFDVGIKGSLDGTLTLDGAKLATALGGNAAALEAMFSDTASGFAPRLDALLAGYLEADGLIESRTDGLAASIKVIDQQRAQLDLRMTQVEERLRKQFTALDSLISQLNSTSAFLTQQLQGLQNLQKS